MDTIAYLGTVVAVCGLAVGAMYVIVGLLGRRIDDLRVHMDQRFDDAERLAVARFDAVGGRFDGVDGRFDAVGGRFDGVGGRFSAVDDRFDAIDHRFDAIDHRFDAIDDRFDAVEERLSRLENQNHTILGAVTDLGQRVTRLEARPAS